MHESVYSEVTGEMIREAALRTKGAGGPSGVDANGFKRLLACKSFKKSSANLCDAVAAMARRLCTEYVKPLTIELLLANRLIPLDKGEGQVRPIGVGEVIRRIVAKCVTKVTKEDVLEACGPDDATGVGLIEELKEWWDVLNDVGSTIGYLPNAKKC